MLKRKLPVIFFMVCLSSALHAQTNIYYSVSYTSPFTMTKNGNKINPPHAQKTTSEKTNFITLDCLLNIYSYSEFLSGGINIYRNGVLIKKIPMKQKGLIVLNADSMGNWSGYIKTGSSVASIYTNGKFVKTVKFDETVSEKIVGVEYNGDVISLGTDKVKSQVVLKKNGNVISLKKFPKLNGVAETFRIIGKDVHLSTYTIAYLINPNRTTDGSTPICSEGSSYDFNCINDQGCVRKDGTLDLKCVQQQVTSGVCPCIDSRNVTETIPSNGCSVGGTANKN